MSEPRREAWVLDGRAPALAGYPHAHRAGELIFVSGVSSRRPDGSHEGVTIHPDGRVELDIAAQTAAVLRNIDAILQATGHGLADVVDMTVFLVDMRDYAEMNRVYNTFFQASSGPARTTVAVHQLPHPNLLVEMKAVAWAPRRMGEEA